MARVATYDRHGLQMKAATYAQLIGTRLERRPETADEAVLLSLLCDLLRGSQWEELLGRKRRRTLPQTRSSGQVTVEITIELRQLQQLALADDFLADLVGDGPNTTTNE